MKLFHFCGNYIYTDTGLVLLLHSSISTSPPPQFRGKYSPWLKKIGSINITPPFLLDGVGSFTQQQQFFYMIVKSC